MASPLSAVHPELFHYTGIGGLEGIAKSQTLWATHAAYSNDAAEIRAFQARLPDILRPGVARGVQELIRMSSANKLLIAQQGGEANAIEEIVRGISMGMFNALLGGPGAQAFAEPYITSFCTAATDQIAQHGLLSQWRSYGHEGGYAVVFDTSRLELLLKQEGEKWGYDLFDGDVIYSSDSDEKIREEFGPDLDELATSIEKFLTTAGTADFLEPTYYALIRCACRYKHWGFHEEKEVRIVAIPQNKKVAAIAKAHGLITAEKPRRVFHRHGTPVPCIHLFEGITTRPDNLLPITRIIVGPHHEKEKRRRAVEVLLDQYDLNIAVSTSAIPYVGH